MKIISSYSPDRQDASDSIEERQLRFESARLLISELIGDHSEEFTDPELRLEFVESLTSKEMFDIAQHINRRMRGMDGKQIRGFGRDKGGGLVNYYTPASKNKLACFLRGYDAVTEYLQQSDDSIEDKLSNVSVAIEGLIVQVHPFSDGNGRTSRFLGEFIQGGSDGTNRLAVAAASKLGRLRYFDRGVLSHEKARSGMANPEMMLDNNEYAVLPKKPKHLPSDSEAAYLTTRELLTNPYERTLAGH